MLMSLSNWDHLLGLFALSLVSIFFFVPFLSFCFLLLVLQVYFPQLLPGLVVTS